MTLRRGCFGTLIACVMTMHMLLTFLSGVPETTGLFLVGSAFILSGIVLRRLFSIAAGSVSANSQVPGPKEQPLK